MPWTSEHLKWLKDTGKRLTTADGKTVEIWEFSYEYDDEILSVWAKHFRNHYCLDDEIDFLRGGRSRKDYLNNIKFPSTTKLGPAIRAGDFGEILVADYLEFILKSWVPRVRWSSKVVRDESLKGSDVIGFRFHNECREASTEDVLFVFESKTKFSNSGKNRLQDAINDSAKDHIRIDESLNFIKQKLFEKKKIKQAKMVERFQNPVDNPYKEIYGAVSIISEEYFSSDEAASAKCKSHPNSDRLVLIIIKGPRMMDLVHELYRRAADEA